jgi:hypothetical protein
MAVGSENELREIKLQIVFIVQPASPKNPKVRLVRERNNYLYAAL